MSRTVWPFRPRVGGADNGVTDRTDLNRVVALGEAAGNAAEKNHLTRQAARLHQAPP